MDGSMNYRTSYQRFVLAKEGEHNILFTEQLAIADTIWIKTPNDFEKANPSWTETPYNIETARAIWDDFVEKGWTKSRWVTSNETTIVNGKEK
jgi:hypothetical protein